MGIGTMTEGTLDLSDSSTKAKQETEMSIKAYEEIGAHRALKYFGGFVRYYDTNEPLPELAALVSAGDYRNILACCGGGDQALTMLGAAGGKGSLWALDTNSAQLFVLAAKAIFLKKHKLIPSFEQLQQTYPGRITAIKKYYTSMQDVHLYHRATGKIIVTPSTFAQKYALVEESRMLVLSNSKPFWQKNRSFINRVSNRIGSLKFTLMDIFDSGDYFEQGSQDLIYMSNVLWPETLRYYQDKLSRMVGLLRPGGKIISWLAPWNNIIGRGVSPGHMLAQGARDLFLKIDSNRINKGYLVLERMKKR
jgi:hypothetical protein